MSRLKHYDGKEVVFSYLNHTTKQYLRFTSEIEDFIKSTKNKASLTFYHPYRSSRPKRLPVKITLPQRGKTLLSLLKALLIMSLPVWQKIINLAAIPNHQSK